MLPQTRHLNPDDLGYHLRQAGPARLLRKADTPEAEAFVERLAILTEAEDLRQGRRKRLRYASQRIQFATALGAWAFDLLHHASNLDALGFLYRSSAQDGFRDTLVTRKHFEAIKACWSALELHQTCQGFQPKQDFDGDEIRGRGFATRYRVEKKLLFIAAEFGLSPENVRDHTTTSSEAVASVKVKSCKHEGGTAKIMRPPNSKRLSKVSAEVEEINGFLAIIAFVGICPPRIRRVFSQGDDTSFDYDRGGRLYAIGDDSYQSMKPAQRRRIRIEGERVVELDITASHLTVFYGLMGEVIDLSSDPYDIAGIPRDLVKRLISSSLSDGKLKDRWPRHTKKDFEERTGTPAPKATAKEAMDLILRKHPVLSKLDGSALDWSNLQFLESEILCRTMLELIRSHDIPTLPVHDSLIAPESEAETVGTILKKQFFNEVGITPSISVK